MTGQQTLAAVAFLTLLGVTISAPCDAQAVSAAESARKTDPRDPVSLAQAMLVCIGGAEHAIQKYIGSFD